MEVDGEQFEDAKERFDNTEVSGKDKDDIKDIARNLIVSEHQMIMKIMWRKMVRSLRMPRKGLTILKLVVRTRMI